MLSFRKSKKTLSAAVLAVILIVLHYGGALAPAEGALLRLLAPVLSRAQALGAGLSGLYQRQVGREDMAKALQEAREENSRLANEIASIRIATVENQILREQLKFFSDNPYRRLSANVISRGSLFSSAGRDTLVIDRGRADGVLPGMAVVGGEGLIIGKVREARARNSLVALVNSEDCRLAALVLGEERTSGITEGELGLSVKMNFIPQSVNLQEGDLLASSGLEELIPRGLVIGKVSAVEKASNELWQSAVIAPYQGLDELLIVAVITGGKPADEAGE